jgi:hypothetical protein
LVGLNKVPLILVCVNAPAPPVIPPVISGADQLYVVPAGTIPLVRLVGVAVNNIPSHTTLVIALIAAIGLTVKVNWNDAPAQPLVIGVTV